MAATWDKFDGPTGNDAERAFVADGTIPLVVYGVEFREWYAHAGGTFAGRADTPDAAKSLAVEGARRLARAILKDLDEGDGSATA